MTHRDDLNFLVTLLDCPEGEWDWNGPAPAALRRAIKTSVDQAETIAAAEALLSSMPTGTDAIREWHERRKDWLFYRKAIVGEIE